MTIRLKRVLSAVEGHNSHLFPLLNKKHQKIFEIKTTESKVYPNLAPPEISVAQFPGSIYPTATIQPGPVKAKTFFQKLPLIGTLIDENTSGRELC